MYVCLVGVGGGGVFVSGMGVGVKLMVVNSVFEVFFY